MGEQVSAEAVEAAAEALHGIDCGCKTGPDPAYRAQAEAALTAALPYLIAHQPARVVPSAEAVLDEQTIDERDAAEEMADRLAAALAPADVLGEHSSTNDPWQNALDYAASQPTVAEVREQVAREIEARGLDAAVAGIRSGWGHDYAVGWDAGIDEAARIARGETKGCE